MKQIIAFSLYLDLRKLTSEELAQKYPHSRKFVGKDNVQYIIISDEGGNVFDGDGNAKF